MLMLIIGVKVGPNWRYYHDRNEVVKPEIQVTCATCVVEENTDYSGFDIDIGGTGPWGSTVVNDQDACAQLSFSTAGSLFWTYNPSENLCWVKSGKSATQATQGIVSGNRECGRQEGGISITSNDMQTISIMVYFANDPPLHACRRCTTRKRFGHVQRQKRGGGSFPSSRRLQAGY